MQPQALGRGDVGELGDEIDRAGVRRACDGRDRERHEACRSVAGDGLGYGRGVEPEARIRWQDDEGLGREAELVERAGDREVGLVARVDTGALEGRAAGRSAAQESGEMDVPDEGHRHEVGHDAARGQQPERAAVVADEVAQPADHLLLDERPDGPGMPDVDALVRPLGEDIADDRHRQRRRREVAERARVLSVELVRGETRGELGDHLGRRGGLSRRRRRAAGVAEE